MKKIRFKRVWAIIMLIALVALQLPTELLAEAASESGTVTVIIENTTFSKANGAAWEGTYSTKVEYESDDTAFSLVVKGAKALGLSCTTLPSYYGGNYISEIGGVAELDGGSMSGWMSTINGWFTDSSIEDFSFANGKLENGDIIKAMYSLDYGADIGSDWMITETTLKSLTTSTGDFDSEFSTDDTEYTLTLPEGTTEITIDPVATNASYQVRTYLNSYTPDSDTYYKLGRTIPVSDGDVIYIGVGEPEWPGSYNGLPGTVYEINVVVEESESGNGDSDNSGENNGSDGTDDNTGNGNSGSADNDGDNASDSQIPAEIKNVYEETGSYLSEIELYPAVSVGGDWAYLGLARSEKLSTEAAKSYYDEICKLVQNNESNKISKSKPTDNARVVLTLTAMGYDATNVDGYDLTAPLTEKAYVDRQGINGLLWSLIALDSANYKTPADSEEVYTREELVSGILAAQLSDGGFSLDGEKGDTDVTAIALQALLPYKDDSKTAEAISKALDFLSEIQNDDGSFPSYGALNVESTAQVICALSGLGIDTGSDKRFVKSSGSALDALLLFYNGEGEFEHIKGGENNQMATEQAYLALTAYYRMKNGKSSLYDMKNVSGTDASGNTGKPDNNPATGDDFWIVVIGSVLSLGLVIVMRRQTLSN